MILIDFFPERKEKLEESLFRLLDRKQNYLTALNAVSHYQI
jgi:hypothetical protein